MTVSTVVTPRPCGLLIVCPNTTNESTNEWPAVVLLYQHALHALYPQCELTVVLDAQYTFADRNIVWWCACAASMPLGRGCNQQQCSLLTIVPPSLSLSHGHSEFWPCTAATSPPQLCLSSQLRQLHTCIHSLARKKHRYCKQPHPRISLRPHGGTRHDLPRHSGTRTPDTHVVCLPRSDCDMIWLCGGATARSCECRFSRRRPQQTAVGEVGCRGGGAHDLSARLCRFGMALCGLSHVNGSSIPQCPQSARAHEPQATGQIITGMACMAVVVPPPARPAQLFVPKRGLSGAAATRRDSLPSVPHNPTDKPPSGHSPWALFESESSPLLAKHNVYNGPRTPSWTVTC